jgi:hypothetical protein
MDFQKMVQYIRNMEKYNIYLTVTEVMIYIMEYENE